MKLSLTLRSMFELHPQLAADTRALRELKLSSLLLMNNAVVPWLILVPRREAVREIVDLTRSDQMQLMDEIAQVSRLLRAEYNPHKINVAALGNVVPQLHVHVIARFENDPAWPKPVWGNIEPMPYEPEAMIELIDRLRSRIDNTP